MVKHSTKKHECALKIGSDSMLPKKNGRGGLFHALRKLTLIMVNHPSTLKHFISYPAVVAERQRQILEGGALIWCSYMMIINLIFILVAPMRFSYILPTALPVHSPMDYLMLALKCVIILDIIVWFNMGYKHKHETYIVMVRRRIALHYLSRWFFVDLLSSVPLGFLVPYWNPPYKLTMFLRLIPCIRCFKLATILIDFKTFVKIFKMGFIFRRSVRLLLIFQISLHWCGCLIYFAPIVNFYWNGKPPTGYCRFLMQANGDLTKTDLLFRYKKAVFIACAAFFGTAFTTFRATSPDEMVTNAIVIVYGQLFMLYTMALLLKIYVTKYNSTMRYQELMNQVEKYMRHKQFPAQMRNRVLEFYKYRYQERYFRESLAMDCLSEVAIDKIGLAALYVPVRRAAVRGIRVESRQTTRPGRLRDSIAPEEESDTRSMEISEQLRNEISLDTCHKLIEKVSLFEGLPASVVGSVLGCLHAEVYMPNDLVCRAGDIGDCMYFIGCGTVAVYSLKGAEVCHLDDGAHFGEVALLMKDRKRVATVIAIEITQVYRLDQADFRDFIMTYQELYERVEALASKRMHETVLIDEPFKQHRPIV